MLCIVTASILAGNKLDVLLYSSHLTVFHLVSSCHSPSGWPPVPVGGDNQFSSCASHKVRLWGETGPWKADQKLLVQK